MEIKYFKLKSDYIVVLPDNAQFTLKKDHIFHVQSQYLSPVTGDEMVVISMDKCTPVAVPVDAGIISD